MENLENHMAVVDTFCLHKLYFSSDFGQIQGLSMGMARLLGFSVHDVRFRSLSDGQGTVVWVKKGEDGLLNRKLNKTKAQICFFKVPTFL